MMKRFLMGACALLLLLPMLLTIASCDMMSQDDSYEISECITMDALPSFSELVSSLLGKEQEKDEQDRDCLNPSGTTYLIVMCYGTPDASHLKERLRFTLISGEEILYDDACVYVSDPKDYDIPNNPFHGVAQRNIEGIMVVSLELHTGKQGTLYVDYLEYGGESATRAGAENIFQADVGTEQKGQSVSVDTLSVGYLTEAAYNDGAFEDAALTAAPQTEAGAPTYMVMDLAFSAREANEGEYDLSCHVCFDLRTVEAVNVEAAPTNQTAQNSMGDVLDVCMTYSIPQERDGQKSVRMILRIASPNIEEAGMHLYLSGNDGMRLEGTSYIPDILATEDAFSQYIPSWQRDDLPMVNQIVIACCAVILLFMISIGAIFVIDGYEWWDKVLPILCAVMASVALCIMMFCVSLSWWVVLIVATVVYAALMLGSLLAAHIVDNAVGAFWPIVLAVIFSSLLLLPLVLATSLVWWVAMLIEVGVIALCALVAGAIGVKM